ncbi:hypothetical protein [Falsigemmobacter faecalis]|uniref:TnsA endonuclease N-terminal domain-containing protein n=1 Tax=Falsigemmobacter faecalis TaxID=2488730 RepID=A0A3P3DTF4_9RHOB|nr:hypothetical protein [Falsigemmobacter faecalis]RRH77401.1 hypothetical protein EG244_04195 [Falsigemmobacter faecalis]
MSADVESANGECLSNGGAVSLPSRSGGADIEAACGYSGRAVLRREPAPSRAQRAVNKVSEWHFSGVLCWGDKQPQRLNFESLLEYQAALCAIYRPGFEDIREQVGPVSLQLPDGRRKFHYIDFCATYRGGHRIGMAVKPEVRSQTPAFQDEMKALLIAGQSVFFDRLVVIGKRNIDPDELANAELFHAARFSDSREDHAVRLAMAKMASPLTIGQMIAMGEREGVTLRSVARAIHRGQLRLLTLGRITTDSAVMPFSLEGAA